MSEELKKLPLTGEKLKKKQMQLIAGGVAAVLSIFIAVNFVFKGEAKAKQHSVSHKEKAVRVETGSNSMDQDSLWKHSLLDENEELNKKLKDLEESFKSLKEAEDSNLKKESSSEVAELKNQIEMLQYSLQDMQMMMSAQMNNSVNEIDEESENNIGSRVVSLNLTKTKRDAPKTVENTIPAGSFAKAVLLSGIDALASLTASADPQPILIKVIDKGTLPRRFKSDVDECHLLAGAYGSLSSERVYMRLEKLTCVERLTGEIIETEVAGYISGEDGKVGVRGEVVEKDVAYLGRSFIGGMFSGLANVTAPNTEIYNPFGGSNTLPQSNAGTRFTSGMANGGSKALDRLSQYYIDRAEQLQPVIQVASGREIDVIFTSGTEIGSTEVKQEIEKVRAKSRKQIAIDNAKNFDQDVPDYSQLIERAE